MKYDVLEDPDQAGQWRVEITDDAGGVHTVTFISNRSRSLASAYKLWMELNLGGDNSFDAFLGQPHLDRPITEDDRASEPCLGCGRRWIVEMDDAAICPRCGHINPAKFVGSLTVPALEYFNRDGTEA